MKLSNDTKNSAIEDISNSTTEANKHTVTYSVDVQKAQIPASGLIENEIWTPLTSVSSSINPPSPSPSKVYNLILDGSHENSPDDFLAAGLRESQKHSPSKPQAEKVQAILFKRNDQLNWLNAAEVKSNIHLFSDEQKHLLNTASIKPKFCPPGVLKGNYFQNIYPIIASNHPSAQSITCCGRKDKKSGRIINCDQWHLCSRCAYRRSKEVNSRFSTVFKKTNLFHLTCSFNGGIPFGTTSSIEAQGYWNAIAECVKEMVSEGWIDGAYLVHELSIRSLLPLTVLPHSHIVISGERLSLEFIPTLTEKLQNYPALDLDPSLDLRLIESQKDFSTVLKYQTEAIDLKDPYDSAWLKHVAEDRKGAIELNLSMKEFLDAYSAAVYGFERPVYFGNLRAQNRSQYIGKKNPPKKKREKKASSNPIQ